jgi:hypothetical protein
VECVAGVGVVRTFRPKLGRKVPSAGGACGHVVQMDQLHQKLDTDRYETASTPLRGAVRLGRVRSLYTYAHYQKFTYRPPTRGPLPKSK